MVSIVVPSYEMADRLGNALDSLLAQTYKPLEILVQDNCSCDGTEEVLRAYRSRLGNVSIEPDRGQSDALRRGFDRSQGAILGWLNADDLLMPDAVERAVAAFCGPEQPDVVYGHCALLDRDGQFQRYFHEIEPFDAARLRSVTDFVAQPSAFFRRNAYEAVGGIDASLAYAMDWDLWCRLAIHGAKFLHVDAVLSGARQYADTKTASGGLRRWREILRVNRSHKTTRIPVAAITHLYGDILRPRLPWLHGPMRVLARRWRGKDLPGGRRVFGIGPDGAIARPGFSMQFPVHRRILGGRIRLETEAAVPVCIEAWFAERPLEVRPTEGTSMRGWELSWDSLQPQWVAAFRLDVTIAGQGAEPWSGQLKDVLLDFAPEEAASLDPSTSMAGRISEERI